MNTPKFDSDLLFLVEKPLPKIYVEELLIKKLDKKNLIEITVQEVEKKPENSRIDWTLGSSMMNLCINDKFLENHFNTKSESIDDFQNKF